jgi:hypothetical protein
MTAEAVFHHSRVFPQIRSSYFGMALKTFQVDVLGLNQLIRNRAVAVVTIRAL